MLIGEFLHIRLFLEGVEVPVVACTVSCTPGNSAVYSVQIPAVGAAFNLLPRTLVHVFFYSPSSRDRAELDKYKLLGVAEVVGINAQKTPMGQQIVLQCMDLSNYWDTTYSFNVSGLGKKGKRLSNFVGANTSVTSSSASIFPDGESGSSKITSLLKKSPKSFPDLKGLLGGIINLLENIGGFYRGSRVFKGFNDFTSLAELRLRLMQQIHVNSKDNTGAKLLNQKTLSKWLKQAVGNKGSMQSFNAIITQLMQFIFYQRFSIAAPPFFEEGKVRTETVTVTSGYDVDDILALLRKITHFTAPTNLSAWQFTNKMRISTIMARKLCQREAKVAGSRGQKKIRFTLIRVSRILDSAKSDINFVTNKFKGRREDLASPVWHKTQKVVQSFGEIRSEKEPSYVSFMQKIGDAINLLLSISDKYRNKSSSRVTRSYTIPDRLGVHLFLPDLYFSPAPRCNVIFPDFYDNLSYQRGFFQEPTRLMLKGGSNRSKSIFAGGHSKLGVYFAPDSPSMRGSAKMSSKKFARSIMEHEKYTGIVPTTAQIPWAKVYKVDTSNKSKSFPYIQRLTNFEYTKKRFGGRVISVNGQFNWRVVPGFPAVVITRGMIDDHLSALSDSEKVISEDERQMMVGAHYVGYMSSVTHTLDQSGGRTSYQVGMARNQWEMSDALGKKTVKVKRRVGTTTATYLVLETNIDDGMRFSVKRHDTTFTVKGPNDMEVSSVRDLGPPQKGQTYWRYVTKQLFPAVTTTMKDDTTRFVYSEKEEDFVNKTGPGVEVKTVYYPKKVRKPKWVKEKWGSLGYHSKSSIYPRVVEVRGKVGKYVTEDKPIPVDAMLTPPWLDKVWHYSNIDDTYEEMLATTSILDGVGLKDPVDAELLEDEEEVNEGAKDVILASLQHKTIPDAVEHIVKLYSYAKKKDVFDFIKQYTDRPVATFSQIFGGEDFELLNKNGKYVAQGDEGFHSRAVTEESDIFSMVDEDVQKVLELSRQDTELLAKLDTRAAKREMVRKYLTEIKFYSMS